MRKAVAIVITALCTFFPGIGAAQQKETLVTVTIPESIMPVARGEKYEDPLDAALKKANVGEVTGAGSHLSAAGVVGAVNIDVRLTDLPKGLPLLKEKLRDLGAPKGTSVEFLVGTRKVQQLVHD